MKKLLSGLLEAARCFTLIDFAVFKVCLLFIGILLGSYFACFFKEYITIVWIVAAVAVVYIYIQVFRYFRK